VASLFKGSRGAGFIVSAVVYSVSDQIHFLIKKDEMRDEENSESF